MKNVLIYPCGTDEGLELNKALGQMIHYRLFGVSDAICDRGSHTYVNHEGLLNLEDSRFIDDLTEIVERLQIDYIYPVSPEARVVLSRLGSIQQAEVVSSSYETCRVCESEESINDLFEGDLFVQNSLNDRLSDDSVVLHSIICFTDRGGDIKFTRTIMNGDWGVVEPNLSSSSLQSIHRTAQTINNKIQLRGPWSFKMILNDDHKVTLIGITPGFSSVMGFYRNKGINLATLSLFDRMGHDIEIRDKGLELEAVKVQSFRYRINYDYDDVYVDLDDTILINNLVNPLIIAFIYQCRNQGKKVHLITKHRNELTETLDTHKITALFDEIIWLKSFDQKCLHMKSKRAIFIDDAFSERKQVSEKLGIPTFEVSAVECLMDWRL